MPHPVATLPLHPQRQARLPNVLFSSRRRYRRQPQAYQGRLPDWVWGAGFGVIVLLFVAGFFLFSRCTANASTCDNPLKPLSAAAPPNNAEGFQQEDVDLNRLITALQQGDSNTANALFFGPAHNFMHTAEPEIRAKNEELGKKLCEAVIKFETDFDAPGGSRVSPQQLANEVVAIRDYLRDGAVVLGYPRPGE